MVKLLSKRWWIPVVERLEGPKLEPEGPNAEVRFRPPTKCKLCRVVDPSKKVPDLKCEVPNLLLEVVDLKREVPDLRSGGIPLNLTPAVDTKVILQPQI